MTMNNPLTGRDIRYFQNPTPTQQRCLEYMDKVAEHGGYEIDVTVPNHANKDMLLLVLELCDKIDAQIELRSDVEFSEADPELYAQLKEACKVLASTSRVGVMQNTRHHEPEDIELYDILFNTNHGFLDIHDVPYVPTPRRSMEIEYEIFADDPDILKQTPNVQLSLLDLKGVDDPMVSVVREEDIKYDREISV